VDLTDRSDRAGVGAALYRESARPRKLFGGEMLVVRNPTAARVTATGFRDAHEVLADRYAIDVVETRGPGDATALARDAAAAGCDVVVALGGDGTANEVLNGLVGSRTRLGCLPGGTANVLCQMLGIPVDPSAATAYLTRRDARVWEIDLGCLNGRYFAASAGVGLDASIVRNALVRRRATGPLSHWRYLAVGVRTFFEEYLSTPPRVAFSVDGTQAPGVSAFVQNGPHYSFFDRRPLDLVKGRALDDGALGGAVLRRADVRDVPSAVGRLLSRRLDVGGHPHVDVFAKMRGIDAISIDGREFPLAVDGEYMGEASQARLTVRHRTLPVLA
jgi:diacylglycerol kinase family enzyme